jgi:N-acetylmuramate 1-kinase
MENPQLIDDAKTLEKVRQISLGLGEVAFVRKLVGDASSRSYFRITFLNTDTAIAMVSPTAQSNDELNFLEVQQYLEDLGLPVPKVYLRDQLLGIVILEDLGDDLLEDIVSTADLQQIRQVYSLALDTLLNLHRQTSISDSRCVAFDLAFDEAKLMQEMDFFLEHFVKGWARKALHGNARRQLTEFFHNICTGLAREPRVFTHRDYHSRNLILKNDRFYMIDFQDARMGPAQYDLASLLRDSYVSLPEDLTQELVAQYLQGADFLGTRETEDFIRVFHMMSLQRNIKALGTFGYQSYVKNSPRYLSAIPRTAAHISRTLLNFPEFRNYLSVLEDYIIAPAHVSRLDA